MEARSLQRLRSALSELAADDLETVLAEARADARARVRSVLTDVLADSMLAQVSERTAPAGERPGTPAPAPMPGPSENGWYVYGVISSADAPAVQPLIENGSVIDAGELAAVARQVALREFGEEQLREHLSDMAWVEATARTHEEMLERLRERVTVIPMRMCTVYRAEDGVREMLEREADALTSALEQLEGKSEWGVKVFADPRLAQNSLAEPPAATPPGTGAAYMEQRRRERDSAERLERELERVAEQIHGRLTAISADGLMAPLQRPEATGRREEMVLNGVYLVSQEDEEAFHVTAAELRAAFADLGLTLEETGPWPAYNFVPGTIGAAW
jgi:hypothetical protein